MTDEKTVIALGFFDGVHLGHAALINKTRARAAELGASSAVLTFDVHPEKLIRGVEIPLINNAVGRADILRRLFDVDEIVSVHFDEETMHTPWRDFIRSLVIGLGVAHLVMGHDFHCGYRGEGTAERIVEYCKELGIGYDVIPEVKKDGITVSSTYIRKLISEGNIRRANEFLGHPHILMDTVRDGCKLGRGLGAPTINMQFPRGVVVPRYGVYATKAFFDNSEHIAVTNIGVKPTVNMDNKLSVETHILDFEGELYGCPVRLEFYEFLRPEEKFNNLEELKAQIARDIDAARAYFKQLA
ncbi:MAG TPA: bifunctional riboflavin kinase/FAD synthetase [Clostridiales bacterium]|nr:bifunctional riboflavin kinase/FAD synthetase [Clostridiales bacterium]